MTTTGIAYLQFLEARRANMKRESISEREQLETKRANMARESIQMSQLNETIRSNKVSEMQKQASLDEAVRSNKANESIRLQQLAETVRSNQRNETLRKEELWEKSLNNTIVANNNRYATNMQSLRDNVASATALEDMGIDSKVNRAASATDYTLDTLRDTFRVIVNGFKK